MIIEANGISYFVEIHQQDENKENLILLHGFLGSGHVFDKMIERLRESCNPVTIDLLGHGKTDAASSPKRLETQKQIEDLALIIQKVSNESVYLYGYSMGGRLALQLAQSKSKLLKGLILESTNPGLKDKQERDERKQLDEQRANKIEKNFDTFLDEWKNLPLFKSDICSVEGLKQYYEIQQKQKPQQMAYSLQGFGTGQMPAVALDAIKMSVLLLAGEKDEKYVKIMKHMNQQLSKSKLEIIQGANHRVHFDKPAALTSKVKSLVQPK